MVVNSGGGVVDKSTKKKTKIKDKKEKDATTPSVQKKSVKKSAEMPSTKQDPASPLAKLASVAVHQLQESH